MVLLAVVAVLWSVPAGLTLTGARARGQRLPGALLAALAFPLTWAVWYVRDEPRTRPRGAR